MSKQMSESVSESVSQWFSESVSESVNESVSQWVSESVSQWAVSQSVTHSVTQSLTHSRRHSVTQSNSFTHWVTQSKPSLNISTPLLLPNTNLWSSPVLISTGYWTRPRVCVCVCVGRMGSKPYVFRCLRCQESFSCRVALRFLHGKSLRNYVYRCFSDCIGHEHKTPLVALFWYDLNMRFWTEKAAPAMEYRFSSKNHIFGGGEWKM